MRQRSRRTIIPRCIVLLVSAFAATACSRESSAAGDEPLMRVDTQQAAAGDTATGAAAPAQVSCEGLETSLLRAEPTRAGLQRAHGAPDSTRAATEPNRHMPEATDSLFTVFYAGLEASFRTPQGARDLISGVTITDNRYLSNEAIGIGAREDDVVRALGEPTRREAEGLVYDCGEAVEQPVTFRLRNGVVTAISIAYYVD